MPQDSWETHTGDYWRGLPDDDSWHGSPHNRFSLNVPVRAFNFWRGSPWAGPQHPYQIDPYADERDVLQDQTDSMQISSSDPQPSTAWRRSRSPPFVSPQIHKPSHKKRTQHVASKPEPGYLALAVQPSMPVHDPASSRKLLVLDLNGTLLLRAPRNSKASRSKARPPAVPLLRTVYPRPYIPAFRAYLFAPETRAWLDSMVWSSAQPHSVQDMVTRVFGGYADGLVQVWDRRYLGMTDSEYHRKTLAKKDLSLPWKILPRLGSAQCGVSALDLPLMLDADTGPGTKMGMPSAIAHSALTTILLDDSPHKAVLQPYNHVCIPEYDSSRRRSDLQSLALMQPMPPPSHKKKNGVKSEIRQGVNHAGMSALSITQMDTEPFDVTLLAVVGVLDEIKRQSNVASWIRGGGLWGEVDGPPDTTASTPDGASEEKRAAIAGLGSSLDVFEDDCMKEPVVTPLWFEKPSTMAYWAARGREALEELGIEVEHGLVVK